MKPQNWIWYAHFFHHCMSFSRHLVQLVSLKHHLSVEYGNTQEINRHILTELYICWVNPYDIQTAIRLRALVRNFCCDSSGTRTLLGRTSVSVHFWLQAVALVDAWTSVKVWVGKTLWVLLVVGSFPLQNIQAIRICHNLKLIGYNALTLSSRSPHICGLTQIILYQYNDFIFVFLMKRPFQRIPTCHIYH